MIYKPVTDGNLTCEICSPRRDAHPIMGGDDRNLSWEEYLEEVPEKYKPHFLLIKRIIEENGLIGVKGGDFSNDHSFSFSDGTEWGFSFRAHGDLMQAIVNKREGYMAYYC